VRFATKQKKMLLRIVLLLLLLLLVLFHLSTALSNDQDIWNKIRIKIIAQVGAAHCLPTQYLQQERLRFPYFCNATMGSILQIAPHTMRANWHTNSTLVRKRYAIPTNANN